MGILRKTRRAMRVQLTAVLLAVVSALLLAACNTPFSGPSQQGYIDKTSSWVDFISLTTNGSQLGGTLDEVSLTSDATSTTNAHASISGTQNGNNLTLQVNASIFGSENLQGYYSGSDLRMAVPQNGGQLAEETFTPATSNDYDNDVKQLQQTASSNAEAQAQAAAVQQEDNQIDATASALDQAYAQVWQDASNLPKDQYLGDASQGTSQAKTDLDKVAQDKAKVAAEGSGAFSCSYDASTAQYDASSVQYDQQGVIGYDQSGLTADINAANGDIATLQSDLTKYQNAASADPSHNPPNGVYTSAQINTVISNVETAEANAQAAMTGYVNTVNQYYSEAQQVAQQAQGIC